MHRTAVVSLALVPVVGLALTGSAMSQSPTEVKLTASDTAVGDGFGSSVALSGNTVLVGAPYDDDGGSSAGSAYVFVRSGTSWSQQVKLTASDAAQFQHFGISVALSGDTAIVGAHAGSLIGASGSAYVFVRSGTSWSQQAKLSTGVSADWFGSSVAVSGDWALVGAPHADNACPSSNTCNSGSAYFFVRNGTNWSQQQIVGGGAGDLFGHTVAMNGDTALIGAYSDEAGIDSGSAHVFLRSGPTWAGQGKLTAGDAATRDYFGVSLAVSGDTALVGAWGDDDGGDTSGSAYVFLRTGQTWSQQAKLTAGDGAEGDNLGYSVAVSGDSALVAAPGDDDTGQNAGSAYVFLRSGMNWSELQPKFTTNDFQFGLSVGLSDNTALVGAINNAYVFPRSPGGSFSSFGTGCAGTVGVPDLSAAPELLPRIGMTFQVELSGMPTAITNTAFGIIGMSDDDWQGISLPRDLAQLGIPGCNQYVALDFAAPLVNVGGTATWQIPLPNNPGLIGLVFYLQGAVLDFGANPANIIVTNAGEATIGGW